MTVRDRDTMQQQRVSDERLLAIPRRKAAWGVIAVSHLNKYTYRPRNGPIEKIHSACAAPGSRDSTWRRTPVCKRLRTLPH